MSYPRPERGPHTLTLWHRSSPTNGGLALFLQYFILISLALSIAASSRLRWGALPCHRRFLSEPQVLFLCWTQPVPALFQVSSPFTMSALINFVIWMKNLKGLSCLLQPGLIAPRSPGPGEAGARGQKSLPLIIAAEMTQIRNALDGLIKGRVHNRQIKNSSF